MAAEDRFDSVASDARGAGSGDPLFDQALLRGLAARRVSRRDILRFGLGGAGAVGASVVLGACGVSGTKAKPPTTAAPGFWTKQTKAGLLNFANWPLYLDEEKVGGKTVHPSLVDFTKQTGIKVNYKEVIQDNESFFGKIQPDLSAGKDTGWDLMVITNGQFLGKLIRLGYLTELDPKRLPNFFANAFPKFKNPTYDPGNKFTVPWQAGLTAIGYNPKLTGREITSFNDLFDPKFKGKVGMFADTLDLPNFAMVGMGINPEKSTPDDWKKVAERLKQQRDAKIVRKYYDQSYIDALSKGDIWISMAYSGDIFQANASGSPDLKFVVPKEGAVLWTDNMMIPAHAKHPLDAITFMNFAYDPKIAAMIAEYVNYITPVEAAKAVVEKDAAEATGEDKTYLEDLARSPLVFPTPDDLSHTYRYRVLSPDEETAWNRTFEPIFQA